MATTQHGRASTVESRIPTFGTVEEEAAFWDTHSFEEFADELEEVDDHRFVAIRTTDGLTVRFAGAELAALDAAAAEAGMGPGALACSWVLERLGLEPQAR